jgi:hypothetical protein
LRHWDSPLVGHGPLLIDSNALESQDNRIDHEAICHTHFLRLEAGAGQALPNTVAIDVATDVDEQQKFDHCDWPFVLSFVVGACLLR